MSQVSPEVIAHAFSLAVQTMACQSVLGRVASSCIMSFAAEAAKEFKAHGLSQCVTVRQRNIEELGFPRGGPNEAPDMIDLTGKADAVFLDLPAPHKVRLVVHRFYLCACCHGWASTYTHKNTVYARCCVGHQHAKPHHLKMYVWALYL